MYLTRRPSGYRFQRRIPEHLQGYLGTSPLRLNLGPMPASEAKKAGRLLAGHVESVFHGLKHLKGSVVVKEIRLRPESGRDPPRLRTRPALRGFPETDRAAWRRHFAVEPEGLVAGRRL